MKDVILDHISKTYDKGSVTAVDDISFSVDKGELFGLIGPDGAGKTSIFRVLLLLKRVPRVLTNSAISFSLAMTVRCFNQ